MKTDCCKDCKHRISGCHETCKDYKKYKLWIALVRAREKKAQHSCYHDEFQNNYKGRL